MSENSEKMCIRDSIYTAVANGTTTAWLSVLVILLMLVVMTFAVTYVCLLYTSRCV